VPYALKSGDGQKLTQEVMGLTGNVSTLRSAQNTLSLNVTTLSTQVTAASSNASAALGSLNALSGNVTTLTTNQSALSSNVSALRTVQNAQSSNVTTLGTQARAASSNASAALGMASAWSVNSTTLGNEQAALSANVTTMLKMVQSLRKELENADAFYVITVEGGQGVTSFQIGKTEVTWGEWKDVLTWGKSNGYAWTPNSGFNFGGLTGAGTGDNHPVTSVSWYDVVKWCNAKSEKEGLTPVYVHNGNFTYDGTTYGNGTTYKAGQTLPTVNASANGYRLPSDKEWKWAARGGVNSKNYTYSGSNTANDVAWTGENSSDGTKIVGTKSANELGIYDMSGNVWEWCWDAEDNPPDPEYRRIRGGSWLYSQLQCALAHPGLFNGASSRLNFVGFRVACSLGN
jgi:formylglycine-generating enzyme required for sulfatase activity